MFVYDLTKEDTIRVAPKAEEQEVEEVKPVRVGLEIYVNDSLRSAYSARLDTSKSFDDLLDYLVEQEDLFFEKTMYTYGTEYEQVNEIPHPSEYHWKVYENDMDITYATSGVKLVDGNIYKLALEKK